MGGCFGKSGGGNQPTSSDKSGGGSGSGAGAGAAASGGGAGSKHFGGKSQLLDKIKSGDLKIVILGESACGKTSVVLRLVKNSFDKVESTIGASFLVHKMTVGSYAVKLAIWDTAGQDRYLSLAPMYYKGADAAIIVYDITNKTSFDTVKRWIDELKARAPPGIVIAIAGNKSDLEPERQVTLEMATTYLRQIEEGGGDRPVFCECSAKSGDNVQKLFQDLLQKLISLAESGAL